MFKGVSAIDVSLLYYIVIKYIQLQLDSLYYKLYTLGCDPTVT